MARKCSWDVLVVIMAGRFRARPVPDNDAEGEKGEAF